MLLWNLKNRFHFQLSVIWNSLVSSKVSLLHLGRQFREGVDTRSAPEHRWSLINRYFLGKVEEASIDHILFCFCEERVLQQLLFALFGIHRVQVAMDKGTLLGNHGSFVGKRGKKVGEQLHCASFGPLGKKGIEDHLTTRSNQIKL